MRLVLNGNERSFSELENGADLRALIETLGFRHDRVAIERNGEIVPRTMWSETLLQDGDKLEVVHFVGGGSSPRSRRRLLRQPQQ